ncbi:hypothetical protein SK854_31335 [Lentzea sp. BCCO 10_0061]|uniref:Secreted protein n=1 Tax=Lentzea sokolovensis TaxID=3095429 RepID=A0ABU4V5X3_9PSEU|nr:hypothetical protein [Lentzea sp. BCCO 10_0061]MDX8146644.1 hypothetical protein [Lentzea sp. BCCO 10_0061]
MGQRLDKITRNQWFVLVGGVVAVLALVAALTGPVPELSKDKTSVTSLAAEAVGTEMTDFALPLDAPLDLLPQMDAGFYCDSVMTEWLRRFGTETTPYHGIAVRSAAEDGAMLSIDNLRAVDVERVETGPVMHFRCPSGGNAETAVLKLRLDRDRKARELVDGSDDTRPFAFNLEPGERGNLEVRLENEDGYSYTGRIVADVTVGKTKETVSLPLSGESQERFDWVSPGKYGRLIVGPGRTKDQFMCSLYPAGFTRLREAGGDTAEDAFDCSLEKVRSLLAEIGRAS